ncbi:MAG: hypothetical protein ACPG3W_07185 [Synechococcus sp.]|uniref:hypothetical protein n=1 Tax=Synechococcus sp. BMK-MC-1 TaxID=1442551 RepID=UPI001644E224|nr:hypothetical protein [Synechococcus sp. BMK-MC-1]QNI68282.1 hypothetical protein SynBMKMC1_02223 [Synechococcus sp. BMK-MC-1]
MTLRLLPGVLLALMLLQACDGTPFGQRLSDSFDDPTSQPAAEDAPRPVQVKAEQGTTESEKDKPEEDKPVKADPVADSDQEDPGTADSLDSKAVNSQAGVSEANPPRATSGRTLPYRITIRLSSADPAAPAEGVTEALRKAGIGFEVETIEKISTAQPAAPMDDRSAATP